MSRLPVFFLLLLSLAPVSRAGEPLNVVLVTLDGVRWQEFQERKGPFSRLWARMAKQGTVLDGRVAAPSGWSLPSYESIFAGQVTPCEDNKCPRVQIETFPERLVHSGIPKEKIAAFASWSRIAEAFESKAGTTAVN